jgi:hypothetical protein
MTRATTVIAVFFLTLAAGAGAEAGAADDGWHPAEGPLATRWTKDVSPGKVHAEYPRPQMTRHEWQSLNGLWDYTITTRDSEEPEAYAGKILVPFPIESALSGVMKRVGPEKRLWYRRAFTIPEKWKGKRILLHFGAVDWDAVVFVNGREVGRHRGGYDPFCCDITEALLRRTDQEIIVAVWDPTDAGFQPRGKQVQNPRGIWYTPATGIWQSVWLEPVRFTSLAGLKITPDIDGGLLHLSVKTRGTTGSSIVEAVARAKGEEVGRASASAGRPLEIRIEEPLLWSPDHPFLYDLEVTLFADADRTAATADRVTSYFGMRKISLGKDRNGVQRLCLNNEPLFQYGPLDQGFWPDGLYTAPTDEALRYDIEVLKSFGFNMARKHVKVEPDRWYYWCDRLGLLVWQDMPSGDGYIGRRDPDLKRTAQSARQFEVELKRVIDAFGNHPSIVMWVPFNEGWGQYDTERITGWIEDYDPTRLVDCASGWTDRGVGAVHDIHSYPGPAAPKNEAERAAVLGEFGGLGLPVKGHTWQDEKNWGYRSYKNAEALTEAYVRLLGNLRHMIGPGLAAAVYTQTTDVEIEVNGLMTYDRARIKIDAGRAREAARKLFRRPPKITVILPAAREATPGRIGTAAGRDAPPQWRYTIKQPTEGWQDPGFDDAAWLSGPAGFGSSETPGAVVNTGWTGSDIWIRRTFELDSGRIAAPHFFVHHDEDAEIYINGVLAAKLKGYTSDYRLEPLLDVGAAVLRRGDNTLAVHCRQTDGGQYIDVGIVAVDEFAGAERPEK